MSSYHITYGMDKIQVIVSVLLEIAQNTSEEVAARLLAIQMLLVLGDYNLAEVTLP